MTETYSKSVDFGGQIAPGQFHDEIVASSITTTLIGVEVDADVVSVIFVSTISGAEKSTLDGLVSAHTPDVSNYFITTAGYVDINSSLADAAAIVIHASDAAGGIDIDAGTGGITIDTTNGMSLDAAAASNFTTSMGNLTLRATAGLANIDGGSGINIGSLAEAQPINIGTPAAARTITVGNSTGASQVQVSTGTGGFLVDTASGGAISLDATGASCNFTLASTGAAQDLTIALTGSFDSSIVLDSQGTGSDSIRLNTAGGIDADATGTINFATGSSAGGAITLDAAFNNGGVTISSGSQGIAINSGTGLIGIGHWSAGDIQIGNSATARTITIGNATGATAVNINTGTGDFNVSSQDAILIDCAGVLELNSSAGVIGIGNDAVAQNINVGTGAAARSITIGNTTGATAVNINTGTGDFNVVSQDAVIMDAVGVLELNSSGGVISIGNDAVNQNMNIGTAGTRTINIGNTTSTTAVNISSGTFGITVGNDANGGEIQIGNVAQAKTVIVGNNTGATRLITRWGTSANIKTQIAETSYTDSNQSATMTQLRTGILTMTPTVNRTVTLPTAANAVADYSGYQINDCIDFTVINLASAGNTDIIIAMGTGGTAVGGNMTVQPYSNGSGTYFYSGTGTFRLRFTNVTASSEAYTVYRIG